MKSTSYQVSGKQILWAAIFSVLAIILLTAAFINPKEKEVGEWVPLNEVVQSALAELDNPNQGEAAAENRDAIEEQPVPPKTLPNIASISNVDENGANTVEAAASIDAESHGKLDINAATASELDDLKGIGPTKAQAIIDDRNTNGKYVSIDDLLRVKGIGEKLLKGIEDSIVARP